MCVCPLETPLQLHWTRASRKPLVPLASVLLASVFPEVGVKDEVGLGWEAILSLLYSKLQEVGTTTPPPSLSSALSESVGPLGVNK